MRLTCRPELTFFMGVLFLLMKLIFYIDEENGSQIVEVYLEELDEDTRKLVEREVVKASLPQNYKQTLGNNV